MTKLLVIKGSDRGKQFQLLEDDLTSLGRDPNNAIQLGDPEISRIHAYIKRTEKGFVIADRKSANGTFVNDRKVTKQLLESRDLIRIGQTTMIFDSSPVGSMVDIQAMVNLAKTGRKSGEASESKIVETVNAKAALPLPDEDSQITDSFLEHLEENIGVIYHTAIATSRITQIDELHQKVLQLIFDWVKADRGCVLLIEEDTENISPAAFRQAETLDATEPIEINKKIIDFVAKNNQGVLTTDSENNNFFKKAHESGTRKTKFIEAMCAPMLGRMGNVGFIYVERFIQPENKLKESHFTNHFSTSHLKMLLAVAHQAALATENAKYYSAMTQNAQLAAVGETFTQIAHHMRNMLQGLEDSKKRVSEGIERKDWIKVSEGWEAIDPLTAKIYNLSLNLLSFSRPRDPQLVLESLNDCIGDVINKITPRFIRKGIKLDWEPNLAVRPVFFDPEAIYRALLNVVQNAVDACDHGNVIKIRVTEEDERVNISVIDDGEGIDPRKINLIFKPFASTKGESGTGIGLPVARKIMREHSGDLVVSSTLGHGSKFTLWMPNHRTLATNPDRSSKTSMQQRRL